MRTILEKYIKKSMPSELRSDHTNIRIRGEIEESR